MVGIFESWYKYNLGKKSIEGLYARAIFNKHLYILGRHSKVRQSGGFIFAISGFFSIDPWLCAVKVWRDEWVREEVSYVCLCLSMYFFPSLGWLKGALDLYIDIEAFSAA